MLACANRRRGHGHPAPRPRSWFVAAAEPSRKVPLRPARDPEQKRAEAGTGPAGWLSFRGSDSSCPARLPRTRAAPSRWRSQQRCAAGVRRPPRVPSSCRGGLGSPGVPGLGKVGLAYPPPRPWDRSQIQPHHRSPVGLSQVRDALAFLSDVSGRPGCGVWGSALDGRVAGCGLVCLEEVLDAAGLEHALLPAGVSGPRLGRGTVRAAQAGAGALGSRG